MSSNKLLFDYSCIFEMANEDGKIELVIAVWK